MYASAAQWEKGQWERENENTPIGSLFSKITLVKAPDQDLGLKKWVLFYCNRDGC
jgi:hypothetical protein